MKKVGIITFHCADDYGGMLQAYASKVYLNQAGYEAEVINYSPLYMTGRYWLFPYQKTYPFRKAFKDAYQYQVKQYSLFKNRRRKMKQFRKEKIQPKGRKLYTTMGLSGAKYDTYWLGSDQIWNPNITYKLRPAYFGNFKRKKDSRCIAYAASIGKEEIEEKEQEKFKQYLKRIDVISLREESAIACVQKLTDKKVQAVVDPTLLLEKEDWEKVANLPKEQSYVLVYFTEWNEELMDYAQNLAKKKNLQVIVLNKNCPRKYENTQIKADNGPSEFLGYIKQADYVVTNSFHCTVMSILFEKKFAIYLHKTLGARIRDLLKKVGLENHIVENKDFEIEQPVNWEEVRFKKEQFVEKSKQFIQEAI